jgi:DNA polymerase-1
VHDELVFEVPAGELRQAQELIEAKMTKAVELQCGLSVEVHIGRNWAEAHA